ncbi:MAG TPA: RNA polymerase sigma factor [Gammaproteobacteria bacterium]|jgi:RNA polymerase sigma-70 factor (ECF subfamily)|nr:RNA polymerase sigma factor [Gammaproteobacteria bacterium]
MNRPIPTALAADAPDAELAARVAAGEPAAFEALMRRHNRTLFRTARAILRDDAEAEDALQEAYLQAYEAIGNYRAEAKLSTWLARIVANEALMRVRKRTRRAAIVPLQAAASEDEINEIPDDNMDDSPERSAQRSEMRRLLEVEIDALPDDYRVVFVLRAVEELSVEETAEALGIPQATVRTRLFRARSLLREALASKIDLACEEAFSFAGERCDRIVAHVLERMK